MLAPAFAPRRLGDLIRELEIRGCRVEGISGMSGPRGHVRHRRIVRTDAHGKLRAATLPNMDNTDVLPPATGRSICVQLGLDPAGFGY